MNLLWSSILHFTRDHMFALHAVEKVPLGAYGVIDYMLAVSSSPQDALMRSGRSFGLVNSAFTLSLRPHRDAAYLELQALRKDENVAHEHIEYVLGNYLTRLRIATQMRCKPLEVHFTFAPPAFADDYARIFGARVRFHQQINRLVFPRELMELPLPQADPELCEILEDCAQRRLRNIANRSPLFIELQNAVAQNVGTGNRKLESLARQFGKSCRSLQREIQANGMTYRELLDAARRERALSLLREQDLPVKEVATRLDFGDPSSFCRAFRRWTGKWPAQYRNDVN